MIHVRDLTMAHTHGSVQIKWEAGLGTNRDRTHVLAEAEFSL